MAQYTCEGAAVPEALTSSCNGVVVYPTAARYTNLSQGYAWDTPAAREAEATVGIEYLATAQTVGNRDCLAATKAYVCMEVFPYCPYPSGGVSYLPACRDMCERVKRACNTDGADQLDCLAKPAPGEHCFSLPGDGFFLLRAGEGSYKGLPAAYVCFLLAWLVMCAGWWRKVCRDRNSTRLHFILLTVPVMKVFILLIAAWFWLTCEAWGYCGFWLGVVLTNAQLVFETTYFFAFLCIANGWCIAFQNISREKWRHILIRSCTFYMCESMLLVFKEYIGWLYWVMTGLLYCTFVFIAFELSHHNVSWVLRQLDQAEDERWNVMAALLLRKLKALRLFQFTMALFLLLEVRHFRFRFRFRARVRVRFGLLLWLFDIGFAYVLTNRMHLPPPLPQITTHVAAKATDNSLAAALIAHEILEGMIALSLAYILYPNPTSGLYYTPLIAPGAQDGPASIAPFYQALLRFESISDVRPKEDDRGRNASKTPLPPARRRSTHLSAVSMDSMTRRRSSFATAEFGGAGESKTTTPPRRDGEIAPASLDDTASNQVHADAYDVKRPWWLLAARKNTAVADDASAAARQRRLRRGFVVVIQNPTRNATAMAARCSLSRASIMIGGVPPPPLLPRRNSTSKRRLSSRDIIKRSQTIPTPSHDDDPWSSDSSEGVVEEGEDVARRRLSTGSNNSSSGTVDMVEAGVPASGSRSSRYFEMEMVELASRSRRSSTGGSGSMAQGDGDGGGRGGGRGMRQIETVAEREEENGGSRRRNRRRGSAPPPPPPPGSPPPNQPRAQHHTSGPSGLARLRSGSIGNRSGSRGSRRSSRSSSGLNEPLNAGQGV